MQDQSRYVPCTEDIGSFESKEGPTFTLLKKCVNIGSLEEVAIWAPANLASETPVLIFCHGNWATYRRFEKYGRFFSEKGFLIIAPTYPYHYEGNKFDARLGKASTRDYAAAVLKLIRRLYDGSLLAGFIPSKPPILFGHSMGGPVAQLVALETQPAALVLVCSAPVAGVKLYTDKNYKKYIAKLFPKILFGKPYLPPFEALSGYVYNRMPEEDHRAIYAGAVHESGTSSREILAGSGTGIVKWLCRLFSKPIAIDENKITCPILIIGGGEDKVIPPQIAVDLMNKYRLRPQLTELRIFEDFAHWPMYEPPMGKFAGWEKSAEYILRWIKDNIFEPA